jgi:hypothetical protein
VDRSDTGRFQREAIVSIVRKALHAAVLQTPFHHDVVAEKIGSQVEASTRAFPRRAAIGPSIQIPLSTISRACNFDAYISLRFGNPQRSIMVSLVADSGNDTLVLPSFDDIKALPNFPADYTVLSESIHEPFRCPAKLLHGPIVIPTPQGDFRIEGCDFFACTGQIGPQGPTANFGTGWISRWTTFTDDSQKKFTVRPPLRTGANPYRYLEFDYAAAATVLSCGDAPMVAPGSKLTLTNTAPAEYQMFEIAKGPNDWWMSIQVRSLTIGGTKVDWPGPPYPMAMVDTGGGPVLLSDPDGYFYKTTWPDSVDLPTWIDTSSSLCQAVKDPLVMEIGDGNSWLSYPIDTSKLPETVQDLTLVLCKDCSYLQGNAGVNIGGISALSNLILIDNHLGQVGFKSKNVDAVS